MELLFFASLFLSVFSYFIYPSILPFVGKIFIRQWTKKHYTPTITIIISAYNEEKDIELKILNTLQLDYPETQLEIFVSSDGSTDRTNDIVSEIKDDRLHLKTFKERQGKTACLNKVIPMASGEIILFTDANALFAPDMLQHMVKNFYDPTIGAVSGWTKYLNRDSGEETTSIYARMEKKTKLCESKISSCVGADGAIFAVRKELFVPLGINDINDFIIPLNVIKQGKRVILDPNVYCIEEATQGLKNIFRRQVRISTRTAWAIRRNISLLNFFRYGSFSIFLLSHKVLRLATPFFLLCTFVINILILEMEPFYMAIMATQVLFLSIGLTAITGIVRGELVSICKYFLITFAAQFIGCLRMLIGIEDVMWTPKR